LPYPGIIDFRSDDPSPHGILANVFHTIDKAIIRTKYMIEKLLLPNRAGTLESKG